MSIWVGAGSRKNLSLLKVLKRIVRLNGFHSRFLCLIDSMSCTLIRADTVAKRGVMVLVLPNILALNYFLIFNLS